MYTVASFSTGNFQKLPERKQRSVKQLKIHFCLNVPQLFYPPLTVGTAHRRNPINSN